MQRVFQQINDADSFSAVNDADSFSAVMYYSKNAV